MIIISQVFTCLCQPYELMFVDARDDSDYDSGTSSNNIYSNDSK
jgi:hypothetical protein